MDALADASRGYRDDAEDDMPPLVHVEAGEEEEEFEEDEEETEVSTKRRKHSETIDRLQ